MKCIRGFDLRGKLLDLMFNEIERECCYLAWPSIFRLCLKNNHVLCMTLTNMILELNVERGILEYASAYSNQHHLIYISPLSISYQLDLSDIQIRLGV